METRRSETGETPLALPIRRSSLGYRAVLLQNSAVQARELQETPVRCDKHPIGLPTHAVGARPEVIPTIKTRLFVSNAVETHLHYTHDRVALSWRLRAKERDMGNDRVRVTHMCVQVPHRS